MINRNHRDAVIWVWTVVVVIAFLSILSTCSLETKATPKSENSEDRTERQIDRAITEADRRADERERRQDS